MAIDQVTTGLIKDDAVTAAKIVAGAVVADIANDSITLAKMADDAVGADQLASDAVVNASVAAGAAIAISKLGTTTVSRVLETSGTGAIQASAITTTELAKLDGVGTLKEAGQETIWVPSNAMTPTSASGCATVAAVATSVNRPDMYVLDFDDGADEHAQFAIGFPKSWNEGTITYRVFWTSAATDTDGVAWGLQGVSVANDATIDVAYGTPIVVTDDNISAAEDCLVTPTSAALTIAGAAVDTMTFFRIFRDVSDGNDVMTEDARLLGIQIFFTTNAANDA